MIFLQLVLQLFNSSITGHFHIYLFQTNLPSFFACFSIPVITDWQAEKGKSKFIIRKGRSLAQNINKRDVENENSAGGTYCCGIIRNCSKKRISWASKSLLIISIRYITRKSKDSVFSELGYGLRRTLYRGSLLASLRSIFV